MKLKNMVMFRLSVYDDTHELVLQLHPKNFLNRAWIPQTLGDQVWLWFEFAKKSDKEKYLKWIENCDIYGEGKINEIINKTHVKEMLMNGEDWITQKEVDYWTK